MSAAIATPSNKADEAPEKRRLSEESGFTVDVSEANNEVFESFRFTSKTTLPQTIPNGVAAGLEDFAREAAPK